MACKKSEEEQEIVSEESHNEVEFMYIHILITSIEMESSIQNQQNIIYGV